MAPNRHDLNLPDLPCATRVNSVAQQLSLLGSPQGLEERWDRFRRKLADAIDQIGPKEVAGDLDVKASTLSHSLAERDRHYFQAKWLLYVIARAPNDELIQFLAAIRGREVVAPVEMTPEEELARTKQSMTKLFGNAGAELIRKDVFGR